MLPGSVNVAAEPTPSSFPLVPCTEPATVVMANVAIVISRMRWLSLTHNNWPLGETATPRGLSNCALKPESSRWPAVPLPIHVVTSRHELAPAGWMRSVTSAQTK